MLSGEIPDIFGNLTQPSDDQMDNNKLSGKIPNSLGFCQQVETLNLASNRLNGSIPNEIFRVSSLTNLNLSHNKLWGPLPSEVGNLKQLQVVDVSDNQLSGNLAASIGGCVTLQLLNLSKNNISGGIPGSVNNGLCSGDQEIARYLELPQCKARAIKRYDLLKILVSAAGVTLFLCLIFCFLWALRPGKKKNKVDKDGEPSPSLKGLLPLISYSDILLATSNFAAENLIGKGGFGSVYIGTFITSDNGANTTFPDQKRAQLSSSTKNDSYWPGKYEECLSAIIRVGLSCAAPSAKDRLSMRETLAKLHEIKNSLLN
ncbi:hypothetical protein SCA6_016399 [Theobroma cacao]